MNSKIKVFSGVLFLCVSVGFFISCNKKASNQGHVYSKFILGVQSRITVFGAPEQKAKYIAEVYLNGHPKLTSKFSVELFSPEEDNRHPL